MKHMSSPLPWLSYTQVMTQTLRASAGLAGALGTFKAVMQTKQQSALLQLMNKLLLSVPSCPNPTTSQLKKQKKIERGVQSDAEWGPYPSNQHVIIDLTTQVVITWLRSHAYVAEQNMQNFRS